MGTQYGGPCRMYGIQAIEACHNRKVKNLTSERILLY